jgi:hypothetical protein
VSGEWIGALGMTEPSAGSDFANIKTVRSDYRSAVRASRIPAISWLRTFSPEFREQYC